MIYERIKNLEEIVGRDACSLTWPLGSAGGKHRDYFVSKSYIKTHIHCQPYRKEGGSPMAWSGEVSDGFLIRDAIRSEKEMTKDEIEVASLYSYQIPDYYGREIDEVITIGQMFDNEIENNFDQKRFVILLYEKNSLKAIVPKRIGVPISPVLRYDQENAVQKAVQELDIFKNGRVVGLWYTNSNLDRTPAVNIEDAWDVGMLTVYYPRLENLRKEFINKLVAKLEENMKYALNPCSHPHFPKKEIKSTTTEVIRTKLLNVSRKLSDIANGNFLAAYNLHEYLSLENGYLKATSLEVSALYGEANKFLELFLGWTRDLFSNVELVWDGNIPTVLASDKEINFHRGP